MADQAVGSTEKRTAFRALQKIGFRSLALIKRVDCALKMGPRRQASIAASTSERGPANTASTEPSRRLRTQPRRPQPMRLVFDKRPIADTLHPATHNNMTNDVVAHASSPAR